jgi:FkbM family methyltransferase
MINSIKNLFRKNIYLRYLYLTFFAKSRIGLIKKRREFYSTFLEKGNLFFDVGANYGNRIEPIIDMGIHIVAIEPQNSCVKYLRLKYGKKISVVDKGLGADEEDKTMHVSDTHVLSSFSNEWVSSNIESGKYSNSTWNEEKKISMTTLDKLINKFGVPRYIKIDVEGYESEVFKGLSQPIEFISFEYTVPEHIDKVIMCLQRIMSISANQIICNYSIGETLEWVLDEWITYDKMLIEVNSERFVKSGIGDIYVNYQKVG